MALQSQAQVEKMQAVAESEFKTKLGKIIFYLTTAVSVWFFYWFNGINCPC
jgi:hypothetical protein